MLAEAARLPVLLAMRRRAFAEGAVRQSPRLHRLDAVQ